MSARSVNSWNAASITDGSVSATEGGREGGRETGQLKLTRSLGRAPQPKHSRKGAGPSEHSTAECIQAVVADGVRLCELARASAAVCAWTSRLPPLLSAAPAEPARGWTHFRWRSESSSCPCRRVRYRRAAGR